MTCNTTILREFDVFATQHDDGFELNRTCNEVARPFEQFCLVPPPSRLASSSTCKPFLQNTLDPSYIFPKTTQGLVKTLEDLPIVYVSFPEIDSTDVWIRDDDAYPPNATLDFDKMQYRGFRPVSQPQFVLSAASSAVANQVFCLLSNSATIVDDAVELYKADGFGLFRTQIDTSGNPIRMRYSTIAAQGMPVVVCNDDGTIQCACVNNQAYLFNAQDSDWTPLEHKNAIITVCVLDNTLLLFSQTEVVFYLPSPRIEIALGGVFAWQCLSVNRKLLFVCVSQNAQHALVYTIDIATRTRVAVAQCALSIPMNTAVYFSALASEGTQTTATILVARGTTDALFRFVLTNSFATAIQDIPTPFRFVKAFYNNEAWFEDDMVWRVGTEQKGGVPAPYGMTADNVLSVTQADIWSFVRGKLLRLSASSSQTWSNDFDLFMAHDAHMSDENADWHFPPSLEPPWYFGTLTQNVPNDSTPIPMLFSQSRHNQFRWIFDSVQTSNNTQFSHLQTHLERINDFFLLNDPQYVTRVYDDANITVTEFGDTIVFETNTHDQASNPQSFTEFFAKRPVGTQNGLYIMYIHIPQNNNARQVVLCYNVFNSSQFADWCSAQSTEFVSRALQQQSTFCFDNLLFEDDTTNVKQFVDSRCECVPSLEMFQLRFPDAFANMASHVATRTIQNIPCLSQKCADIFLLGQENTNVLNYARDQCKQNMVIASDTVLAKGTVIINPFKLTQDCGTANRCTNNAQCPANSFCFNGTCLTKCTTDDECKTNLQDPLAHCQKSSGKCLYGTQSQTTQTKTKWYWIAAAAVAIVIAIILLIVMLAMYF